MDNGDLYYTIPKNGVKVSVELDGGDEGAVASHVALKFDEIVVGWFEANGFRLAKLWDSHADELRTKNIYISRENSIIIRDNHGHVLNYEQ